MGSPLAQYATRWLAEFYLTTTHRFSDEDIYISDVLFRRAIIGDISIPRQRSDNFYGTAGNSQIDIEFDNAPDKAAGDTEGYFTKLQDAGEEFRGKFMKVSRYEPAEGTLVEFYGMVSSHIILDTAKFRLKLMDPDVFLAPLPKKVYETGDFFTDGGTRTHPAVDLGKPYSLCLGYCKKVPLRYVSKDTAGAYDYIIGPGTIESNNSNKATTVVVYRNKVVQDSALYTVYDGSQGSPYAGYAFIRFTSEQTVNGAPAEITMDLRGLKLGGDATATRNFAKIIQYILSDSTWGLGLTVDSASFTQAITDTANLYCDGAISDQRKAQDIIGEMLYLIGGTRYVTSTGTWGLLIDKAVTPLTTGFGDGDGFYENLIDVLPCEDKSPTTEAMKTFILFYRLNPWTGEFQLQNKRNVLAFGDDRAFQTSFVRDSTTADRITSRIMKRQTYCDQKRKIRVGMEARDIFEGSVIPLNIPRYAVGNYEITGITRVKKQFVLDLQSYNSAIFSYTPGTIPPDPNPDDQPDYSATNPSPPTALAVTSWNKTTAPDGTTFVTVTLQANAPATNLSKLVFGYKRSTDAVYTYGDGQLVSGVLWKATLGPMPPGFNYDFIAYSVNATNLVSVSNPTLTNQMAPGDTMAPAQVNSVTGAAKFKTLQFNWPPVTTNADGSAIKDLRGYHAVIASDVAFNNIIVDKIIDANTIPHTDEALTYGATFYCHAKAVDFTGNESASWSGTASATTGLTTGGDLNMNPGVQNVVRDGDAELGDWTKEWVASGAAAGNFTMETTIVRSGKYSFRIQGNGAGWVGMYPKDSTRYNPVKAGEKWYGEYYHKHSAGAAGTSGVLINYYDKNKTNIGNDYTLADPGSASWRKGTSVVAIDSCPAGTAFISAAPFVYSDMSAAEYAYFDDIILYKQKDTPFIQDDAVTVKVSAYTAGSISIASIWPNRTEIQTLTYVGTGAAVLIGFSCQGYNSSSSSSIYFRLEKDGNPVGYDFVSDIGINGLFGFTFRDVPTAGSHTYRITASAGAPGISAAGRSLWLLEVKK